MNRAVLLLSSFALVTAAQVAAIASQSPADTSVTAMPATGVAWLEAPGRTARWTVDLGAAADSRTTRDLMAERWQPRLPALTVSLLEGGMFDTRQSLGRVVVMSFWATWCAPCREELPQLQRLSDEMRDAGLLALTINAEEPDAVARAFMDDLGLTLPVGRYDRRLDAALAVSKLPTVVIVDRAGRIRQRWDGYHSGVEQRIAERARELLAERGGPVDPRRVATVHTGAGRLAADWYREAALPIDGLTVARDEDGPLRIATAQRRDLALFDAGGAPASRFGGRLSLGPLRSGDLNGDTFAEVIGFRPGSRNIVLLDPVQKKIVSWVAPHPVLDVAVRPANGSEAADGLLLATTSGLVRASPQGDRFVPVDPPMEVRAVASPGAGGAFLALATGRLIRYGADGTVDGEWPVPEAVRGMVSTVGGIALYTDAVRSAAIGRFFAGAGEGLALVTADERLIVLDANSGDTRFEAHWPGISHVAAADLDGGGLDRLIVASGKLLTVLKPAGAPSEP